MSMQDSIYVDLTEKQLSSLELGGEVSITIKGTVNSMRAPMKHSDKEKKRAKKEGYDLETSGSASIDIKELKLDGVNEFTKMSEEE